MQGQRLGPTSHGTNLPQGSQALHRHAGRTGLAGFAQGAHGANDFTQTTKNNQLTAPRPMFHACDPPRMIAGNGNDCRAVGGAVGSILVTVVNNCITSINYWSPTTDFAIMDTHV